MHTGVSSPTNSLSLWVVASMLDTKENSVRRGREGLDIREMVSRMGLMVGAGEVWRRRVSAGFSGAEMCKCQLRPRVVPLHTRTSGEIMLKIDSFQHFT